MLFSNEVKVSIATVTYNHEEYIIEAMESVINQKTNFKFEMIIGEDCSSDSTKEIIREYETKYPDIIKPIYNTHNLGGRNNYLNVLNHCNGKYIAILDGDDVMMQGRLQKEVDFLEQNSNFSMVAHNMNIIDYNHNIIGETNSKFKKFEGSVSDLVKYGCYVANSSVMYRKKYLKLDIFETYHKTRYGDTFMHMIVSSSGKIGFIDEVLGLYRKHDNGITANQNLEQRLKVLDIELGIVEKGRLFNVDNAVILEGKARLYFIFAQSVLNLSEYAKFKELIQKSWDTKSNISKKQKLYFMLKRYPSVLKFLISMYRLRRLFK